MSHTPPGSEPTPHAETSPAIVAEDNGKPIAIYALMLAGIVTGITPIIAVILAYVFKDGASPVHVSHYNNAINIFWKSLLYMVIATVLTLVVIGIVLWIVLLIWLIVRCAKGLNLVSKGQPYPNPGSWGF